MSVETEIKLQLLRNFGERAMRSALCSALAADLPRAVSKHLRSIYVDTEGGELAARHMSLRLRQIGNRWVQTLKVPAKKGIGLQAYHEAEAEIADGTFDLSLVAWKSRDLDWLKARQDRLRPVFETDIQRSTWLLEHKRDKVELAWDRGHIRASNRVEAINELELELKAGTPGALFQQAAALTKAMPLRFAHATKAERGMRLVSGSTLTAQRQGTLRLSAKESTATAFRKIAEECLRQMQANESAILAGGGADSIHQFRVALRRLRAAIGTFRNLLDEAVLERWAHDMKWTHQAFGRARDLDVLTEQTLAALMQQYPGDAGLQVLVKTAEDSRKAARAAAQDVIDSRRYSLMQLDVARVFHDDSWCRPSAADISAASVLGFAKEQLQRRYKKVRKLANKWPNLDVADLHRLRILVKKMRYAALAFSSLFPAKASRSFLTGLEALQDCLGALNDGAVGKQYVTELAAAVEKAGSAQAGEVERAVGLVAGWHARGIEEGRQKFNASWLVFKAQKRFWT